MKIAIGADHRGFELKNKLIIWLTKKGLAVADCGNNLYDPEDDYPDFVKKVISQMTHDERRKTDDSLGIVICGSGVGVAIAANRYKGIYCGLGFNSDQVAHARINDHINVLALPADYSTEKQAREMVMAFLTEKPLMKEKYLRRVKKLDQ